MPPRAGIRIAVLKGECPRPWWVRDYNHHRMLKTMRLVALVASAFLLVASSANAHVFVQPFGPYLDDHAYVIDTARSVSGVITSRDATPMYS